MKKSWLKIGLIVYDVVCAIIKIFRLEFMPISSKQKHRFLRDWILANCKHRGWRFTPEQIDTGIHNTIFVLKEIFRKPQPRREP
jgi:hypothetical protein